MITNETNIVFFCFSLAKNEDTLKHILGTIPSDSLGKGLEKYIRLESFFKMYILQQRSAVQASRCSDSLQGFH